MKYSCIIFDCDGTLLDTLGDIASAMNGTLVKYGYPAVPTDDYRLMVSYGIYRLAELALPMSERTEENIKLIGDDAAKLMAEQQENFTKPYPGILDMLSQLSTLKEFRLKKIKTAVLSNKPDPALRLVVKKHFSSFSFDAVKGSRPGFAVKPDPSMVWDLLSELDRLPQDTVFIGDSEIDIETARNAGCYPLGVSWGFRSCSTLDKAGAAKIINEPDELLEFFL